MVLPYTASHLLNITSQSLGLVPLRGYIRNCQYVRNFVEQSLPQDRPRDCGHDHICIDLLRQLLRGNLEGRQIRPTFWPQYY